MMDILDEFCNGQGTLHDLKILESLANTIKSTSLCGLGQTAPNPVLTTLKYFRDEYEAHIVEKRCPGLICKSLIEYSVIEDKCKGCQKCMNLCLTGSITGNWKEPHIIDNSKCTKCRTCYEVCPFDAISGDPNILTQAT
jgi:ferredoxin